MRCCLYHKPFSLSNFSQLSQDRWRNKANETYNFFLKRQTTRDTYLNTNIMERSLKLHKTQDCRWPQVTLEPKTARIGDFIFNFLFPYLRVWTIVILILSLSLYLLQRKLRGADGLRSQWSQKQQELKIVSLHSYLYLYFLITSFHLDHYLYPYYKENSRLQVGSGLSGAKNRKNWKFLLRSVVDMWQRSRTGNFLERVPSFLFVFYRTQVRLLLCPCHAPKYCWILFKLDLSKLTHGFPWVMWICQYWYMDFS